MSDVAHEFRAHGELWGITEPKKRRDLFTMEWGGRCLIRTLGGDK